MPAEKFAINRRGFLVSAASAMGAATAKVSANAAEANAKSESTSIAGPVSMVFEVNGQPHRVRLDIRTTLLDMLREHLHLTGTKKGCDQGQCGACTVHVDGRRVLACLTLAASAQGKQISTIEGLANGGALHPMQRAFIERDGFQCGYCTPGQIMSAIGCVNEGHAETDDDIREYMSGNLCRCAAYPRIVEAIKQARYEMTRHGRGA